jgi:hypothetical protein
MNEVAPSIGILSNMITPAVLILATGSLIMTTSQRLSRAIERVRRIAQEFAQIEQKHVQSGDDARQTILFSLLKKSARRSILLTRAMTYLYISLGLFVATSLAIGIVAVTHLKYTWIPTALGVIGAVFLFLSSAVLIVESRLTFTVIADEVDFVIETSKSKVPLANQPGIRKSWRSWFKL